MKNHERAIWAGFLTGLAVLVAFPVLAGSGLDDFGAAQGGSGGGGSGTDLTGLGTDNRLARWNGTDTVQDSSMSLSDAGQVSWASGLGAITHLLGPSDQSMVLNSASGQDAYYRGTALAQLGSDDGDVELNPNINAGGGDVAVIGSSTLSGQGLSALQGFRSRVYTYTGGVGAPASLTASQSGCTISNEGATAQVYVTLPTAVAGYRFRFVLQDANGIHVTAASGDTIRVLSLTSATAGYAQSTTIGSVLTLEAINATEWVAVSAVGTWSVDS